MHNLIFMLTDKLQLVCSRNKKQTTKIWFSLARSIFEKIPQALTMPTSHDTFTSRNPTRKLYKKTQDCVLKFLGFQYPIPSLPKRQPLVQIKKIYTKNEWPPSGARPQNICMGRIKWLRKVDILRVNMHLMPLHLQCTVKCVQKEHNSESITSWTLLKFLRITQTDREGKHSRLER